MFKLASSQQVCHPLFTEHQNVSNSLGVSARDVSAISHLFIIPVKFSDTVVSLLYTFVVADMAMQPMQVMFSAFCGIYVHKARDVSAPNFVVLQLFANAACLFHLYQVDGY